MEEFHLCVKGPADMPFQFGSGRDGYKNASPYEYETRETVRYSQIRKTSKQSS